MTRFEGQSLSSLRTPFLPPGGRIAPREPESRSMEQRSSNFYLPDQSIAIQTRTIPTDNIERISVMSSTVNDADKIAVFHEMMNAWHNKEWRKCADLFTPDGVLHSMMIEPVVGRETIYQRLANLGAPNKRFVGHVHRIGVIDGTLVAERTDEVIIDGISRSYPVVGLLDFDGSLISLWREYYDRSQLLKAQGRTVELQVS
ncbi:MAG: limonene-1,2-epoxide hydrolase family protein [Burkholderiaceae bacterium]|nr:limonene-1,2-epoxide hydrolase family protein [Burkholderiaceae bacterium]